MGKEITIPTSWADVTLDEFIKLSALDIKNYNDSVNYYIDILEVFGNTDLDTIIDMIKVSDINDIINQMSFMNEPPRQLDIKEVLIKGVKFKLTSNMNDLTVGEYVSIESLIEQGELNSFSSIPVILSVLLRPEEEVFDSNKINSRIELFKKYLSIEDVLGMSVFFSTGVR